jgi:hypothetical protein
MRIFILITLNFLIASCFENDERVHPYPGVITTISDSIQIYQSWFDLETGMVTSVNPAVDWELAFENRPEGWRIKVNSGADWFIYRTSIEDFTVPVQMPSTLRGLYDLQQLWPDSTATGNWNLHQKIYLLAKYKNGSFAEPWKIRFLNYTDSSYSFYFENSMNHDTVTIVKDNLSNFSYYSFRDGIQVYPEPDKAEYDIVFTSYYDTPTLFGQTIPYKVGGVLLNTLNTMAAVDSVRRFDEISISTIEALNFTGTIDVPGYNWKDVVVDITGGGSATYNVKSDYNYIILTAEGNYFKLRFLSYTIDGRSGFPRFEFSLLE